MRLRGIVVCAATVALVAAPAWIQGIAAGTAGARTECTIRGTAADDQLNGTTRDDVRWRVVGARSCVAI